MSAGTLTPACFGQHRRVLADQILVDDRACALRPAVTKAAFVSASICSRVEPHGLVARHGVHHLVEDRGDDEDFLLADAQQVVVVGRAGDDRAGGVVEVGGLIDDDRRIARPGDDGALRAAQGGPADGGAAGDAQQRDVAVIEDRLGRFQRRLVDDA